MQVPTVFLQQQMLILTPAVKDLTDDEVKRISAVIDETQTVEGDLRREVAMNIKRLQEIGCYQWYPSQKGTSGSWSEDKDQR